MGRGGSGEFNDLAVRIARRPADEIPAEQVLYRQLSARTLTW